jgi:hypothetical protein
MGLVLGEAGEARCVVSDVALDMLDVTADLAGARRLG